MNVYFIILALIFVSIIGNSLPSALFFPGHAEKCTASQRSSVFLGFIFSLCQLPYLIQITKHLLKSPTLDQLESSLIQDSPKLFPAFIYQIYFVAMSSFSNPVEQTQCYPIQIQQTIFKLTAGLYIHLWTRGILFGYNQRLRSKLLVVISQVSANLMTLIFEYLISSNYGQDILRECNYVIHLNLLLIVAIFAFTSLSFAFLKVGSLGFALSLPICYALSPYMASVVGWIVGLCGGDFDIHEMNSERCPYKSIDYMLWSLPFVAWFMLSLTMSFIRFFGLNRIGPPFTELNLEDPEFFEKGSVLREKTFGKHKLPVRIAEEKKCTICWEEFGHGEKVSFVEECFHIYHSACINKWVSKGNHCPLCKRKIKAKIF